MSTFRETCRGKMSVALQAMVDGLLKADKRGDFEIRMSRWLGVDGDRCFGCAASCAVQDLSGLDYKSDDFAGGLDYESADLADDAGSRYLVDSPTRANFLCRDLGDLNDFENAINNARCGFFSTLAQYMDCWEAYCASGLDLEIGPLLSNDNWRNQLPRVRTFIRKLKKAGL